MGCAISECTAESGEVVDGAVAPSHRYGGPPARSETPLTEKIDHGNGEPVFSRPLQKGKLGVTKPEWGTKRECQNCGARFYDLKREPIVCPKCETVFAIKALKPKPSAEKKPDVKDERPKEAVAVEEVATKKGDEDLVGVDVDVDDDDEDQDDAYVAHASELEGDDDVDLGIETDIKDGEGER